MITYYSKKDCKPCEFIFEQFKKKFKNTEYTKIVLRTNEEKEFGINKTTTIHATSNLGIRFNLKMVLYLG
jgi:hypothetical protein